MNPTEVKLAILAIVTMWPWFLRTMLGTNSFTMLKWDIVFTSNVRRTCSSETSRIVDPLPMPALLTKMVASPCASLILPATVPMLLEDVTSTSKKYTFEAVWILRVSTLSVTSN